MWRSEDPPLRQVHADTLADLRRARRHGQEVRPGIDRLFPETADAFFAAERIRPAPAAVLDPAFSIVVAVTGAGVLDTEHGDTIDIRSGQTILIPYAAGHCTLRGDLMAIRCRPPYDSPGAGNL